MWAVEIGEKRGSMRGRSSWVGCRSIRRVGGWKGTGKSSRRGYEGAGSDSRLMCGKVRYRENGGYF